MTLSTIVYYYKIVNNDDFKNYNITKLTVSVKFSLVIGMHGPGPTLYVCTSYIC